MTTDSKRISRTIYHKSLTDMSTLTSRRYLRSYIWAQYSHRQSNPQYTYSNRTHLGWLHWHILEG